MDSPPTRPRNCPSLEDLCLQSAIDNVDLLGDVGQLDASYLRVILPHCSAEQLLRIEKATKDRDLYLLTNDLWRKCYLRKFGADHMKTVVKRMKETDKKFKWKALYQAKLLEQEEAHKEGVNRLRELYKEANEKKATRQLQKIDLFPPMGKKRQQGSVGKGSSSKGSSKLAVGKGRLMKKARTEYIASLQTRGAPQKKPVVPSRGTGSCGRK